MLSLLGGGRALAGEEIVDDATGDAEFGDGILRNSEEKGDEAQEHQLLLDLLQSLYERLLVLPLQNFTQIVEKTLRSQRDAHDH